MVEGLVKKAARHSTDEFNVIPGDADSTLSSDLRGYDDLGAYEPQITDIPAEEKIQSALRMEAAGLDFRPRITGSMMAVTPGRNVVRLCRKFERDQRLVHPVGLRRRG